MSSLFVKIISKGNILDNGIIPVKAMKHGNYIWTKIDSQKNFEREEDKNGMLEVKKQRMLD